MTQFGQRLVEAMANADFSVLKLAEVSGISSDCIYNYFKKDSVPNAFSLACLADALVVSMDWLWGRDPEKMEPVWHESIRMWECAACGGPIRGSDKFCPECGRKQAWGGG